MAHSSIIKSELDLQRHHDELAKHFIDSASTTTSSSKTTNACLQESTRGQLATPRNCQGILCARTLEGTGMADWPQAVVLAGTNRGGLRTGLDVWDWEGSSGTAWPRTAVEMAARFGVHIMQESGSQIQEESFYNVFQVWRGRRQGEGTVRAIYGSNQIASWNFETMNTSTRMHFRMFALTVASPLLPTNCLKLRPGIGKCENQQNHCARQCWASQRPISIKTRSSCFGVRLTEHKC